MKAKPTGDKPAPILIRRGSFVAKIYEGKKAVGGRTYRIRRLSYYEPGGKRVVRDFADLADAKLAANDAAQAFAAGRPDALSFTPEERQQFDAAAALLAPLGVGLYPAVAEFAEASRILPPGVRLLDAVRDYARRHPANAPRVTVAEAVAALIEDRTKAKASDAYLVKLDSHLNRFAGSFTGTLASLSGPMVGEWLRTIADAKGRPLSNRTRQNHHGSVVTLFKFARARGWVSRDLAEEVAEVPTPKAEAVGEVGIFTPPQLRKMLATAPDDIRASLALGAFAGLRTEEIHRLDWADVKLAERVVIIGAEKAKTASRRVVPIADALAEWLAPLALPAGPVDPSPTSKALTHRWCRVGERVGVKWTHNGLRHSAISYRLALIGDPARVAFESGNSPAMIARHYKALVTEAEGRAWFDVRPGEGAGSVVPMPAESRVANA